MSDDVKLEPGQALTAKIELIGRLIQEVRQHKVDHPEDRIRHYRGNPGSILNAYREGDLSFDKAVEELRLEDGRLRYLLWLHHGHMGLYGDDGEMQCPQCRLDFKRAPIATLESVFHRQSIERAAKWSKSQAEPTA